MKIIHTVNILLIGSIILIGFPSDTFAQNLVTYSNYSEICSPDALLPTLCRSYEGTVKCTQGLQGRCLCNMETDAIFKEDLGLCVGIEGALCQMEKTMYSRKVCVQYADCMHDRPGNGIGICKCLEGYERTPTGECICPEGATCTATPRPTTPKLPLFPSQPPTSTRDPEINPWPPAPDNGNGARTISITNFLIVASTALAFFFKTL